MLASHPLAGLLSQSLKPELQERMPQTPVVQTDPLVFGRVLQAVSQLPQWLVSVCRLTSQPLEASPSQSV